MEVDLASGVSKSSNYRRSISDAQRLINHKQSFTIINRDLKAVPFRQRQRSHQCASQYLDRSPGAAFVAHSSIPCSSASDLRSEGITSKQNHTNFCDKRDYVKNTRRSSFRKQTSQPLFAHTLEAGESKGVVERKQWMLQTLLAAALLVAPVAPPSADALQLNVRLALRTKLDLRF